MNTQSLISATVLALLGSVAVAQEATPFTLPGGSTTSRAAVQSDAVQARADGTLDQGGEATVVREATQRTTAQRDQVRADARQALRQPSGLDTRYIGG